RALLLRVTGADGRVAWGDAVAVQYAGTAGRDAPIDPPALAAAVERAAAALEAAGPVPFAEACAVLEAGRLDARPLHPGLRYGLGGALLGLAADGAGVAPARVLAALSGVDAPVRIPVYAQSGEERHTNVDRMLLRRVDVLPHGLINAPAVFGAEGE